jgi:hypothetical protein
MTSSPLQTRPETRADPANGFVTGQTLYVCGGTSVGSIAF